MTIQRLFNDHFTLFYISKTIIQLLIPSNEKQILCKCLKSELIWFPELLINELIH